TTWPWPDQNAPQLYLPFQERISLPAPPLRKSPAPFPGSIQAMQGDLQQPRGNNPIPCSLRIFRLKAKYIPAEKPEILPCHHPSYSASPYRLASVSTASAQRQALYPPSQMLCT